MKQIVIKTGLLPLLQMCLCSIAASCIYDYDNCSDAMYLTIDSKWVNVPNASCEGVAYIFFPADGSVPWRFDFQGKDGGQVLLPVGEYSFISHNDDGTREIFSEPVSYNGYEVYTASAQLPTCNVSAETEGENVVTPPDALYGSVSSRVSLCTEGVSYIATESESVLTFSPDFVMTVYHRPLTAHYKYRIEKVENMQSVRSMSASLSGMAGSLFIATGEKGHYPVTLYLRAAPASTDVIDGEFYTFGIPSSPDVANILTLYAVLNNGRKFCYKFDVTEQIRHAANPMDVLLTVGGIEFERPEEGEGAGFNVEVDDWTTVVVNIND